MRHGNLLQFGMLTSSLAASELIESFDISSSALSLHFPGSLIKCSLSTNSSLYLPARTANETGLIAHFSLGRTAGVGKLMSLQKSIQSV